MTDRETISVYDARAEAYQKRFQKNGDPHLAAFMAGLSKGARVLDLGCGPGGAAVHMVAAGLEVLGVDASQGMVETARKAGIDARQATFDQIPEFGQFDAIWANFSLLHAPRADLDRHLGAIRAAVADGGLFHIGMKTGAGERRDRIGRLYSYFSIEELEGALERAGFSITSRSTGRSEGLDATMADWVILLARADA